MFIKSLIIESKEGLIRKLDFHQGLNLIVDETPDTNTETGNNVGKTTILRLIDICLGKEARTIYISPEDRRVVNEEVKTFLTEKEVVITLILVSDWTTTAKEVRIRRNFLSRKNAIQEINGENYSNENEFKKALQYAIMGVETNKPTFRQLVAHNVRYTNAAVNHTLHWLEGTNSDAVYETLHLYMLGLNYTDAEERQQLLQKQKTEESFRKKLVKEKSRNALASELGIVKSEIEELEHIKKQMHLNPDFDNDMTELSDLKYKITVLSSQLSSLKLRYSIMEEAKEEILSNKSDIDADTLKLVYNQAKRFVPNLHHTFEDLLKHHNSMLVKKADFIASEMPDLKKKMEALDAEIRTLHTSEKKISEKLLQSSYYTDYDSLIADLTQKHEKLGALNQQIEQIDKVEARIDTLNKQIANIDNSLFSDEFKKKVQSQLDKLNIYLAKISQLLYAEQYGMVYETETKNKNEIYKFNIERFDADTINFSSGKKQGEIVCFDMAYILFADKEHIACLHFGLYDKKELMHGNQLLSTAKFVEEYHNLQFVASILSDKLPNELKDDKYIVVKLSQNDKLFKF